MEIKNTFSSTTTSLHGIIKTHQVVESDALLSAAHVFKEAVICNQQQGAGIFLVIVSLSLLSVVVVVPYEQWERQENGHRQTNGGEKKKQ